MKSGTPYDLSFCKTTFMIDVIESFRVVDRQTTHELDDLRRVPGASDVTCSPMLGL